MLNINYVNYVNKIAQRLGDPSTSSKCYWSLLKTLLNGKKSPCIPPLFHGYKFIVDFQEKSEIFNSFFANQCSPISNGSVLPSELPLRTDSSLSSCHCTISIRMVKICGDSVCRPLSNLFACGYFSLGMEKSQYCSSSQKR